jgi:hypothetical protein
VTIDRARTTRFPQTFRRQHLACVDRDLSSFYHSKLSFQVRSQRWLVVKAKCLDFYAPCVPALAHFIIEGLSSEMDDRRLKWTTDTEIYILENGRE